MQRQSLELSQYPAYLSHKKKPRKSPIRHHVNTHLRNGRRVRAHMRGRGTQALQITRRKIPKGEKKSFVINFKYSDRPGDGESVIVIAKDYHKALDEAWEEKHDPRDQSQLK